MGAGLLPIALLSITDPFSSCGGLFTDLFLKAKGRVEDVSGRRPTCDWFRAAMRSCMVWALGSSAMLGFAKRDKCLDKRRWYVMNNRESPNLISKTRDGESLYILMR
jgi:hypothetical protein